MAEQERNKESEYRVVMEHAQRMTVPISCGDEEHGMPVMLVPQGWKAEPVPGWEPSHPYRVKAEVVVHSAESFCEYFNRYARGDAGPTATQSVIFANVPDGEFVGILDYHRPKVDSTGEFPAWGGHRVTYKPAESVEWKRWKAIDKKQLSQIEFAQFLEDNLDEVVKPAGADLLAMINTIAIDESITFRSAQRLQSGGVKFGYASDGTAKAGNVEIPAEFWMTFPIFDGQKPSLMRARLRYRLTGGKFVLWLELVNPHKAVKEAMRLLLDEIEENTEVVAIVGKP